MTLAGDLKNKLSTHVVDLRDKEPVDKLPRQIKDIHGEVDAIINNAGIVQPFIKVNDLDFETIERVMNINYYGTLYMVKAFLPHLLKRPEAHIANVSSMEGFFPVPGQTIYGASKAAVKLLTEGLYAELLDTNVNVTLIIPGAIGTDIVKNSGYKISKKMDTENSAYKALEPQKAADLVVTAIKKNKFRAYVGIDSKVLNIIYKFFPKGATKIFSKLIEKSLLEN